MISDLRTDMAIELADMAQCGAPETRQEGDCRIDRLTVDEKTAEKIGKPRGSYITLSFVGKDLRSTDTFRSIVTALAQQLRSLLKEGPVLVACLGNTDITPDAIGPKTAEHVIATRHLIHTIPEYFADFRPVCVFSPGVLGNTGMESAELIGCALRCCGAKTVIAIDALAAVNTELLCAGVQLTDTGICPGSGVGNRRSRISRDTLGVDVIAVGVPTVTDGGSLAADMLRKIGSDAAPDFPTGLIVTPKDIDMKISQLSRLVGFAVNLALHEGLTLEEIADLLAV